MTVSLRGTLVSGIHMSPFQLVFEPSKCPIASTETSVRSKKTSVRSKKKEKKKNSKRKVRRRTERRRQHQRGGNFLMILTGYSFFQNIPAHQSQCQMFANVSRGYSSGFICYKKDGKKRGGKFQRASPMFFSYTRISCRYGFAI